VTAAGLGADVHHDAHEAAGARRAHGGPRLANRFFDGEGPERDSAEGPRPAKIRLACAGAALLFTPPCQRSALGDYWG